MKGSVTAFSDPQRGRSGGGERDPIVRRFATAGDLVFAANPHGCQRVGYEHHLGRSSARVHGHHSSTNNLPKSIDGRQYVAIADRHKIWWSKFLPR